MKLSHVKNKSEILGSKLFLYHSNINRKITSKKIEDLISHKISIETLLFLVKNCKNGVLSKEEKSKNKNIKSFLLDLKDNLNQIQKTKKKNINYLEKEISKKKSDLHNRIYNSSKAEKNKKCSNKKDIINNKDNINLKSELLLLNTLNFIAENYIEQIDNIIFKKENEYNYVQLWMNYTPMEEKEILCYEHKYYPLISKILYKKLIDVKNLFKLIVSTKQNQNKEIEDTSQNLIQLKNYISKKNKGYMDNKKVIQEKSKEFNRSLKLNKMSNKFNINNLMNIYDDNEQNEKKYNGNTIIIEELDDESFKSNSISRSLKNEKSNNDIGIYNNIKQLIKLNMNINFNVNINNNDIINIFKKTKKKKKFSSTGSLPNINSIKEDIFDMPKYVNNKSIVKDNKKKKLDHSK